MALKQTFVASVWSPDGPMILHVTAPWRPVTVNVRIGSVLPLLTSAIGRVFATWLPSALTSPLIEAELNRPVGSSRIRKFTRKDVDSLRVEVLAAGVGAVRGDYVAGVNSTCAPVFNYQRQLVLGLAVVGLEGDLGEKELQEATRQLSVRARGLSAQLGCPADALPGQAVDSGMRR